MLAGREVVEEALVVVDEEGRRLLLREGRQTDIFAALPFQLHRPPDHVGRPKAGLQFIDESLVETHPRSLSPAALNVDGWEDDQAARPGIPRYPNEPPHRRRRKPQRPPTPWLTKS